MTFEDARELAIAFFEELKKAVFLNLKIALLLVLHIKNLARTNDKHLLQA